MAEGFWAKALFDYKAVESTELSVNKNDIVFVEEQNDSGWCLAKKTDQSGWLPTDYVEKTEERPDSDQSSSSQPAPSFQEDPIPDPTPDPPAPDPDPDPTPEYQAPDPDPPREEIQQQIQTVSSGSSGGSGGGGGKICFSCGGKIESAFVVAKEKTFHADHFRCNTCNQPLGGKAFIEKDNHFYCEDCYYNEFNPKCGHCGEVIKGQYISALNQSWHPDHFVCTECGQPFEGNQFHKHNDKPYCDKHYNELFAENCAKCGLKIEGQVFEALEQKFHLECFVCSVGEHKIGEGVNFHLHNDKVYCPEHFEELFLQKCAGCNQTIKGQYVKVLDSHFHPQCWKCADCGVVISSENCGQSGGKFYCRNCVAKKSGGSSDSGSVSRSQSQTVSSPKPSDNKTQTKSGGESSYSPPPSSSTPGAKFYTYDALKDAKNLPSDVNAFNKEEYLADDVFLKMFKMDKATFAKLPVWKKKRLKQKVGLF